MAEYVERDTAIKRIKEYALSVFGIDLDNSQEYAGRSLPENYCEGLYEATELIDDLPAADVAPVRHGRWLDGHCSECGAEATFTTWTEPVYDYDWEENLYYSHDEIHNEYNETNYCPNCGAKMDG